MIFICIGCVFVNSTIVSLSILPISIYLWCIDWYTFICHQTTSDLHLFNDAFTVPICASISSIHGIHSMFVCVICLYLHNIEIWDLDIVIHAVNHGWKASHNWSRRPSLLYRVNYRLAMGLPKSIIRNIMICSIQDPVGYTLKAYKQRIKETKIPAPGSEKSLSHISILCKYKHITHTHI